MKTESLLAHLANKENEVATRLNTTPNQTPMSLLIKRSELFEACRIADYDVLEELLTTRDKERHAAAIHDLHHYKEHKTGLTPLLLSCCNTHNSDLVVLLYKHGATLDQVGLHRETCLHLAAKQAREDVLDKLLRMLNDEPDLKQKLIDQCDDEGSTPLMCACFAGDIPCMRLLREHGAFLDKRNYLGQTPLMKAVCFRNQRVLDWLLTAQVDTLLRDKRDRQAVDYARERGLVGMMEKISGKTITDELDMWIDEKAHLTGQLGNHLKESRTLSLAPREPSVAEQMQQAVYDAEALAYEQAQLETFSSTYGVDGPGSQATSNNTMGESYSYTPLPSVDDTDPYQLYEQSQIDERWEEFMDYENDCPYWYNDLTSESVYERPWCLGGKIERMSSAVATAKATVFKSMMSTAGTGTGTGSGSGSGGGVVEEGKVDNMTVDMAGKSEEIPPTKTNEDDNGQEYKTKVKNCSEAQRKAVIAKIGKPAWKNMSWKERWHAIEST